MSFPPRPAAPTVARHVPTLTEVIEVQPQPLPEPTVDLALTQSEAEPALADGAVVESVGRIDVPDLVLADAVLTPAPDTPRAAQADDMQPLAQGHEAASAPVLSEQDRAVLPRAVLRPSALTPPDAGLVPSASTSPAMPSPLPSAAPAGARPGSDVRGLAIDEAQIVQRVHADLQRQIDGMLEYRLREAMAPVLARTTELLVRELRQELSKTMKDVVARAVAQEVARQRSRQGQ